MLKETHHIIGGKAHESAASGTPEISGSGARRQRQCGAQLIQQFRGISRPGLKCRADMQACAIQLHLQGSPKPTKE